MHKDTQKNAITQSNVISEAEAPANVLDKKPSIKDSFNPSLTIFKTVTIHNDPQTKTLIDVYEWIKGEKVNSRLIEYINEIRNESNEARQKELKTKHLPSIMFNGLFTVPKKTGLIKASGMMVLDFDGYLDKRTLLKDIEVFKKLPFTVMVFISPRGMGVKVVIKIPVSNAQDFERRFKACKEYFKKQTNLNIIFKEDLTIDKAEFDPTSININRHCFYSYDPNVYLNLHCEEFTEISDAPAPSNLSEKAPTVNTTYTPEQYRKAAIESCVESLHYHIGQNGKKHAALDIASFKAGGYIAGGYLREADIIPVLENEILRYKIEKFEAAKETIIKCIDNGKAKPIKTPPYVREQPPEKTPVQPIKNIPLYGLPQEIQGVLTHYQNVFSTPIDIWTGAMFGALATAIGNGAKLKTKYENSPLFWLLTVAPSGTGKTQPQTEFLKPFHYRDGKEIERFKREVDKYMKYKKLPKAERDEIEEETPPETPKQFIISDTTPEALMRANQNNTRGISLHRDEFNGFLKDIGRYNKSGEIEQLLSIWSGNPTTINRSAKSSEIDSGITHILEPYINIFGGIQDGLLSEIQKNGMDDSGFMARFLYVYPDKFDKPTYNRKEVDEAIKRQYYSIIDSLIMFRETSEQTVYTLSAEAEKIYEAFFNYNATLINKANEVNDNYFAMLYAKLDVYALRFALLFHCVEYVCTSDPETKRLKEIRGNTMKYAIDVCEYFRSTGEKVMHKISADKLPLQNKDIALALHEKGNSQKQIADVLKISQPAVNKLLKPKQ